MSAIDGKSLIPATNAELEPLVGQRVTFLVGGEVIRRTVRRDERNWRDGEFEQYIGWAIRRGNRIDRSWMIVG